MQRPAVALAGDRGYRVDWIDDYLLGSEIDPVIRSKVNEDRNARPVEFDKSAYRNRNIVERLIGWMKETFDKPSLDEKGQRF